MFMRLTTLEKTEKHPSIDEKLKRLEKLTVPQLRARHAELFGRPARSNHKEFLIRQIAWQLQAEEEGGLLEETRQLALAIARQAPLRIRIETASNGVAPSDRRGMTTHLSSNHDSRLPIPGSLLIKEYKGETRVVKVLDDGFEYDGKLYTSLSAIAQEITGTKWNGFAFFSLNKEASRGRR